MQNLTFDEVLKKFGVENITRIYVGHESGCRCGCRGNWHATGTRGFKMALTRICKANPEIKLFIFDHDSKKDDYTEWLKFESEHIYRTDDFPKIGLCYGRMSCDENNLWIDYVSGKDRTITVYFKR